MKCNFCAKAVAFVISITVLMTALFSLRPAIAGHDRVRLAITSEPTTLNPVLLFNDHWYTMMSEIAFEPLLRLGPDLRWVPALATEEPSLRNGGISPNGKRITFHLRRGTVWSDGAPVSSADVEFFANQILNSKNNVISRASYNQIQAIHTPDAQTIVFSLKRPDAGALTWLEGAVPLPKHLLKSFPDLNRVAYNALPIGNGPYRVTEWKRGEFIHFEANRQYWRGRPKIPKLEIRFTPSINTELLQFMARDIDVMNVPASFVERLPAAGISRSVVSTLEWTQLGFNLSSPILSDRQVRRALMLAVDRDLLARVLGHGVFKTDRLMLPMFQWALDSTAIPPAFDPQAARRLLDKAGWEVGSDGLRHKHGETLSLTMVFAAGGNGVLEATVAADLERVNVRTEQKPVQASVLYNTASGGGILATGNFDLALIDLETEPDPDMSWEFSCDQRSPVGYNWWRYCNASVDANFIRQASTFDRASRSRALGAIQHELLADAAFDPLFREDSVLASADWLHGIVPSVYGPFWNVYTWTTQGS